jgi:hypothetical protein
LCAAIAHVTPHGVYVDGTSITRDLGEPRVANTVLIDALSRLLEDRLLVGPTLSEAIRLNVLRERVPSSSLDLNLQAFQLGRSVGCASVCETQRVPRLVLARFTGDGQG